MAEQSGLGDRLHLLLSHADTAEPALPEGLAQETVADAPAERPAPTPSVKRRWGDPNDLGRQRWGVIAPEGQEGDRLLDVIRPLMERREAQQGARVQVYRAPAKLSPAEAARWKKRHFDTRDDLDIELPRYQLILGDLHQVPLALQQIQSSDARVGRLAFDRDDDYRAYVEKLLYWEDHPSAESSADALFHAVNDGTTATKVGQQAMIDPGVAALQHWHTRGEVLARNIVSHSGDNALSKDEFVTSLETRRPTVLFSLSHGQGPPRGGWQSPELQRQQQGAMCFGRDAHLLAEELADREVLPGGVWFMFACFGAGTPAESVYHRWLSLLVDAAAMRRSTLRRVLKVLSPPDKPFVAALPKTVLASPRGPLAFVGHIDLAWSYSFLELDDAGARPDGRRRNPRTRAGRFMTLVQALLAAVRSGIAFQSLSSALHETNQELTALYDEARARELSNADPEPVMAGINDPRRRLGHLWMLRQDLGGYVLLGDPAVQLPLQHTATKHAPAKAAAAHIEATPPTKATREKAAPAHIEVTPVKAAPAHIEVTPVKAAPAITEAAPDAPSPPAIEDRLTASDVPQLPARTADPTLLRRREAAIASVLSGTHTLQQAADTYALVPKELKLLVRIYSRAGREAIADIP